MQRRGQLTASDLFMAVRLTQDCQALNNSELLARSREFQLVELAVSHFLRFAEQCLGLEKRSLLLLPVKGSRCCSWRRFPEDLKYSLADGLAVGL